MEATGGMSASAQHIYEKIILASRDDARSLWPHEIIASEFRGAIAVALQTRNAMTMIAANLAIGRTAVSCAATDRQTSRQTEADDDDDHDHDDG